MLLLSVSLADKIIESASSNPLPAIGVLIALLLFLWGILKWSRKQYLISYPFTMSFCDGNPNGDGEVCYAKKKFIDGVHGLFPDRFVLDIHLRKELVFEQINIRLVKKEYFSTNYFTWKFLKPQIWTWKDARNEKMIRVEEIKDLYIENSPMVTLQFANDSDLRGGRYGYYNPSYSRPRGSHLTYEVKFYIDPDIEDEWSGYISFEHYRGGTDRSYARRKIIIRNLKLEEK